MKHYDKILPYKIAIIISLMVLIALDILNFYGVYTNQFYFSKPDNYIFPILSLVHLVYLYFLWYGIGKTAPHSSKLRNTEFALYVIMIVYIFKIYDSVQALILFPEFVERIVPETFKPVAVLTLTLYCLLTILTITLFRYRKQYVGPYNVESYNEQFDIWK